ncbi:MAG TPA: hypothetical protein VFK10_05395, partial [Burkholderiaceae bacterium]|nr:hypothetical protein [Burkholderiaceae bacterium]
PTPVAEASTTPARQSPAAAEPVPAAAAPTSVVTNDATAGQAPVSVATATHNPRERCGGRHLLAMHRCLVRECDKPEYSAHRECAKVRDIEARARSIHDSN